jgi:hypothetical protein
MQAYELKTTDKPRFFLFSMRNLQKNVWRCAAYEFEDVICKIDDVDFFAPRPTIDPNTNDFVKEFAYRFKRKMFFSSDSKKIKLNRNYYCFFFYVKIFQTYGSFTLLKDGGSILSMPSVGLKRFGLANYLNANGI